MSEELEKILNIISYDDIDEDEKLSRIESIAKKYFAEKNLDITPIDEHDRKTLGYVIEATIIGGGMLIRTKLGTKDVSVIASSIEKNEEGVIVTPLAVIVNEAVSKMLADPNKFV